VRPQAAEAAVRVLRRAGYEVAFPRDQTCCGQPAWNSGYPDEARRVAATTLRALASGEGPIVGLSGSCVATVLHAWPELFAADARLRPLCDDVCGRLHDFGALLAPLAAPAPPAEPHAHVAYHCSCHQRRGLRDLASGPALVDALVGIERLVPDGEETCCGFGGTFAVKFGELSTAMGTAKARRAVEAGAGELVSGDLGCLLHVGGCAREAGLGLRVTTLPELLDRERWEPGR
jgi:L-lactate dehydrogenase complex protein LldE